MSISLNSGNTERISIGKIVGAHGIRGGIRILPLTDYPERFFGMERIYIEKSGRPHRILDIESIRPHDAKGQLLAMVSGVTDRDAAEALTGYIVTVAPEERVELPDGEYWIDSLIGLDVLDDVSGEYLGKVEDVMSTGGNDVYQVRTPSGEVKIIPAIEQVVRNIDLEKGAMIITVIEGLWD
ncbi:MAG: ribosome maturation factor RimM [Synergistaceae bacterium]|jgi:16S rRNA processing protein RimM|nr:ribosome maturation factor RimM [Synergistaceae bacterium]